MGTFLLKPLQMPWRITAGGVRVQDGKAQRAFALKALV